MAHTAADLDASAIRLTDLREDGKAELIEIIEAVSKNCLRYALNWL